MFVQIKVFAKDNSHLAWVIPLIVAVATALDCFDVLATLVLSEFFSLGVQQYTHHRNPNSPRRYFGAPVVLVTTFVSLLISMSLLHFHT